jgi:DnaJ-domain-containing protein 1
LAPDGYYLFVDGKARAFHPGFVGDARAALSTVAPALGVAALISLMFESTKPLGAVAKIVNDTYAKEVIAFFEQFLTPPPVEQVPIDWSKIDWSKIAEGFKPKREDPYVTLGITPLATREEVRKAHREKSASVHPDKVAALAPELQQFAHDLFVRVQAAHDEIKGMRGWE